MVQTGTKSPEEVNEAEEALLAEAEAIAVTVTETTWLLINIHWKGKWKTV